MKKCIAILLTLLFSTSLCSCGEATANVNSEKYKKLIDSLESKEIYNAYSEFLTLTKDFKEDGYQAYEEARAKELEEYKKKVTEIKINKDNLLDYFEIVNSEAPYYNEFNEITTMRIKTEIRLKDDFTLADSSKCDTSITASFSALDVIKTYSLNHENGLFILGDYAPYNDEYKKTKTLEVTIYDESQMLGDTNYWGFSDFGPNLSLYENVKVNSANGTLYLIDEEPEDEAEDKYEALIEALKTNDIHTAYNEFFELTKESRKKNALKEIEEYKKKVTEVEINYDNLLDYFEFVNLKEFTYNDFNEVESIYLKTVLRLKEGFTLADTSKCQTSIYASVGVTETTRIFHFDSKSNTFVLKGYAPRSNMNVQLHDYDIAITENSTDVFIPSYVIVGSDRPYIQLGENGRVFDASGTLYLLNK